jgi:hypothetical protein
MIRILGRNLGLVMLVILAVNFANAAQVLQVKGQRALIELEGLSVAVGTELIAMSPNQKPSGYVRISSIKGDRAIGTITKGGAKPGFRLIIRNVKSSSGSGFSDASRANERDILRRSYKQGFGILAGMAMSSATLTARTKSGATVIEDNLALKGNSFNFKAIYDYHMSRSFTVRAGGGLETLNTTASVSAPSKAAVCSNSTSCTLALNYLSAEIAAQFNLINGETRVWAGAGYAFLLAMSKNNNISNLEATSTNQAIFLGGGADIAVGAKGYIPIVVEYGLFPFAGIQLSGIYLRAGYGWKF